MTVQASAFTPEVLISAPRRSPGVPNATGDLVLYTVSTYSFETHSKSAQIRVLSLKDGASHLISEDTGASNPIWLSDTEVAFFKGTERGTYLYYQSIEAPTAEPNWITTFRGSLSSAKAKPLSHGKVALVAAAITQPSGAIFFAGDEKEPFSSGKIYDSLFVRHWDTWKTKTENALWYGQLAKRDGQWTLECNSWNLLAGIELASPVGPFGGATDFDIHETGVAFVAKDPTLNLARYTKTDLYFVPLQSYLMRPGYPQIVNTGNLVGYTHNPTFSRDGKSLAFLRMKEKQNEADKHQLLVIPDINNLQDFKIFYPTSDDRGSWDRSPGSILWTADNKHLILTAEQHGRVLLWKVPASSSEAKDLPTPIFEDGTVVDVYLLGNSTELFVSSRTLVESSRYLTLDHESKHITDISSSAKNGKTFGLTREQCFDIWYPGSAGYDNHALCMVPSNFDKKKKYPLAFVIHGGPQSAWLDDWSTRWNPAILAEQGYVVVCPNPTGSTGYGQAHTDAIVCNWGGAPYQDLVKAFEYIEKDMPFVDIDRSVALGASYGGYMMNWIQGHPLGRRFKAIVCHDGVFSTLSQWSTEELFFPEHDFGGTLWDNRENYEKWDPARHTGNWETPMLVIHNELDYRLSIAEGLAMFNVLQARSIPSKLLVFPDENHWVLKPENSLVWHREVLNWINKFSGVSS
ncbi:oligopeptidase family protein [Cordyceps militaris CM01]|uniref:Dipeptidyl-peptidase V n=1 Tax=Cordyceps militaris (strain CM01) TaxID=983644 RepID=G3JJ90_CORMM|nr:oligopeptidase family protein [Cordyceps militaris CM01]EGX92032.1 oligopeptidase family protein [Cordyceps militaris CM01]